MIKITLSPITTAFFQAQPRGRKLQLPRNPISADATPGIEIAIDPKPEQYITLARGGHYYAQGADGRCWAVRVPKGRVVGSWRQSGNVVPMHKAKEVSHVRF